MGLNDKGAEVVKNNKNYFISELNHYIYNSLRRFTPLKVRNWIRRQSCFIPLLRLFGSNVYCRSYYDDVERLEGDSVRVIAEWICTYIKPKKAIDVGRLHIQQQFLGAKDMYRYTPNPYWTE